MRKNSMAFLVKSEELGVMSEELRTKSENL